MRLAMSTASRLATRRVCGITAVGRLRSRYCGKEGTMNPRTESAISIAAALFVLLATMLDPRVSAGLAVVFLAGLGIYKFSLSR